MISRKPFMLWVLAILLLFLAFGGFYGGILMLVDPTGEDLQMDEILPLLPVPDFILPGIFLILIMGAIPLILAYGIIYRSEWGWVENLTGWSGHHWAWTATLAIGFLLILWLAFQSLFIGFRWPIQFITLINAIMIILVALLPTVRRYYK
jgi:hypothetical protein